MKKILYIVFSLSSLVILLSGCNSEEEVAPPAIVEVDLQIEPKNIQPNDEVIITATVTQGEEKVDDADEMTFEIWKKGNENHEKIAGEHQGDGVYSVTKQFSEKGIYVVISHVTARGMHTMPQKQFPVGDVSMEEMEMPDEANHGGHGQESEK